MRDFFLLIKNTNTLNEIFEIPESIRKTLDQQNNYSKIVKAIIELNPSLIIITGSGTSYNAGLATRYFLNKFVRIPTSVIHAAEFEYLVEPILKKDHLLICISQSGESATTLKACEIAHKKGITTISITAHPDSAICKITSFCLQIRCGDEKSVMATKTYVSQIAALFSLSIRLSESKEIISKKDAGEMLAQLSEIPEKIEKILPKLQEKAQELSKYYKFVRDAFILGSGPDYATATEGALKLKEGSRILAQSFSTDEFRHGPITLADETVLIIGIIPKNIKRRKIVKKLFEIVKERHSTILGIATSKDHHENIDFIIKLPEIYDDFNPILTVIPLQLLANFIALERGYNPDKPRFLQKIVYE
jgi:glucosamine--fructose-6-phosphate aminotransferase (isomerizing)